MTKSYPWLRNILVCGITIFISTPALSQITPDNTLGAESSRITPNALINGASADRIDGGATRGSNLFHSFSDFNVGDGQRVYFGNPNGIQNILTRVTGGNASSILGTLGVDGGANLFLLNPNGIIFGQNASLDLRGSFVGTTANAIGFGEQGNFSATDPNSPPLLTVQPAALLYTQINGASIVSQSIAPAGTNPTGLDLFGLRVPDGQSLLLAGGDVQIDGGETPGGLTAQGGRIELAAIAGSGTVGLNPDYSLSIPTDLPRADIAVFNSEIGVTASNNSGVAIHARNLDISGNSRIISQIGSDVTTVDPKAGDISLDATDTMQIREGSLIANAVAKGESGKGGNINVTTGSLSLSDGAQIYASTLGTGDAGSVFVQALDSVSAGNSSSIFSIVQSGAKGNGGNINITASTLTLTDDGQLSTSVRGASGSLPAGEGIAGDVNVNVSGDVTISGVKNQFPSGIFSYLGRGAKGKGGNINITAGSLSLSDGAQLDATTFGIGDAGSVIIDARRVFLDGKNTIVFSIVETTGRGKGGDISITTDSLSLTNSAVLTASTLGEGDAGNVLVQAKDSLSVAGNSYILSHLGEEAKGKGGNINLKTGSLFLTDGAQISASTFGIGDAGSVLVQAKNSVSVANNSGIFSTVESGAVGNGGNINITAPTLSLTDGGQLSTFVRGASNNLPAGFGIAGNVIVDVSGDVTISGVKDQSSGIFSYLGGGAKGKGGSINITASSLFLTDGAQISASTFGIGDANSVLVQAKNSVSVANNSGIFSIVESGAKGNGGNVNITAPTLSLTDGGQLSTFVSGASNDLPAGFGIAGNVIVDVSGDVTISGVNSPSGISSTLAVGAKGKGGNINITAGSLSVTDGATLFASTGGEGDAGNIQINATDRVTVSGTSSSSGYSSALLTSTSPSSTGIGGDISVDTNVLRVSDGAVLDAGTGNDRNGGNITVKARQVEAINGGQFLTSTFGSGNAGKITLNATEQVIVNGSDPTFDDRVAKFNYRVVNPEAASGFFVRSQGSGVAGDIEVTSPQIRLDNGGRLIAESTSGNGGDINIVNSDLLLLRRNSTISTNAGQDQGSGNGGNIKINAKTIAAVPKENSDITAKAFSGRGGNVTINTDGLFGIVRADFSIPQSDITASSERGVQGQIDITQPDVQPTQGIVELPGQILDASNQIASVCPRGNIAKRPLGEFVVSGRGSLPPNPLELLPGTTSLSPLASIEGETQANISSHSPEPTSTTTPTKIVEAQGWVKTPDGKIALVANAPQATPVATTTSATCQLAK